jgi:hypothetical protein
MWTGEGCMQTPSFFFTWYCCKQSLDLQVICLFHWIYLFHHFSMVILPQRMAWETYRPVCLFVRSFMCILLTILFNLSPFFSVLPFHLFLFFLSFIRLFPFFFLQGEKSHDVITKNKETVLNIRTGVSLEINLEKTESCLVTTVQNKIIT